MPRVPTAVALLLLALASSASERAVMIYPRQRPWFRRVFYTPHQRALRSELAKRFAVEVHAQVATEEELLRVDVRGARLLVLSAHGGPFAMFFDRPSRRTLDAGDVERLRVFFAQLDPAATIVLQSCETGRGFAWAVKEAAGPGRRVIAAKGTIPPDGLTVTSLDPLTVEIRCRDGGTDWDCRLQL